MTMPGIAPEPLRVVCRTCKAEAYTFDYQHPDRAITCSCCPLDHDHAAASACPRDHEGACDRNMPGCNVCRPLDISGTAHLRFFEMTGLLDAGEAQPPVPACQQEVAG